MGATVDTRWVFARTSVSADESRARGLQNGMSALTLYHHQHHKGERQRTPAFRGFAHNSVVYRVCGMLGMENEKDETETISQ